MKHVFPADADYELFARLNRTILNGYAGVEGWDKPHEFVILLDGEEVFSAKVGGPEDHAAASKDAIDMIPKIEERLKGKVFVTAGTHEVGYTWREKQFERQDVWETSLRDSQEVHLAGGLPRLRTVSVRGPFNVKGVSNSPSRERVFVCRPATAAEEPACAQRIFSTLTRRAYRRPVTAEDVNAPLSFYKQARTNGGDFDAGIRAGRGARPGQPVVPVSRGARPRRRCAPARRTRSATSSWRRGSRSSCGAAFPTSSC